MLKSMDISERIKAFQLVYISIYMYFFLPAGYKNLHKFHKFV